MTVVNLCPMKPTTHFKWFIHTKFEGMIRRVHRSSIRSMSTRVAFPRVFDNSCLLANGVEEHRLMAPCERRCKYSLFFEKLCSIDSLQTGARA